MSLLGAGNAAAYVRSFAGFTLNVRRLVAATMCLWVGIGIFGVLFNLYLISLGYSVAFVGLLAAVSTVGQAGASPILGRVLRRWRAHQVMTAAGALAAVSMAASAILAQAVPLVMATLILGAAIAAATIPSSPFIMEQSTVARRAHVFSAYTASSTFGSMAGSLLSGIVPAVASMVPLLRGQVASDRLGLLLGAAITAVGVISFAKITADRVEESDSGSTSPSVARAAPDQDATRSDMLAMMVATLLIALSLGLIFPLFNVYFATVHHASTATIGLLYAASGVICTVAVLLGPVVAKRGTLPWLVIMRALSAPVILVLWVNPGLAVAFMAYVGRNILGQITGVLENTFSMEIVPAQMRAAVASWRTFSYNVGWSVASVIAGVVVVHLGFDPIFLASALLTLAGAATWYQRFGRRASLARFPLHSAADRPSV